MIFLCISLRPNTGPEFGGAALIRRGFHRVGEIFADLVIFLT